MSPADHPAGVCRGEEAGDEPEPPFAASSSPKNPSLHEMQIHLPDTPALLKRSILHRTLPSLRHPQVLRCRGPFLLFLPPQKPLPREFSAAWLIRGQTPAASGISQQLHGVSMAQFQGKPPAAEERDPMPAAPGAEELGQAREDTQMMLLCFPQLSFFPTRKQGFYFPMEARGGKRRRPSSLQMRALSLSNKVQNKGMKKKRKNKRKKEKVKTKKVSEV